LRVEGLDRAGGLEGVEGEGVPREEPHRSEHLEGKMRESLLNV